MAVGIEKPDDSLRLLKRLDQPVEKNSVEAAIGETDAVSFDELGRSRLMRTCRHGHVLSIGAEFDHGSRRMLAEEQSHPAVKDR